MSYSEGTKECPAKLTESTETAGRSFDGKEADSSSVIEMKKIGAEVLACESDNSIKSENDGDQSTSKLTSSSKEESSLRLDLDTTPDGITKIPESQDPDEDVSIVETSHPSTIEIETTETTTEKTTLSSSYGGEGNSHKHSLRSDAKDNSFGKSSQEEDHSLHISQDELFGSHTSVVASTPQSNISTRVLVQKEVTHVEMGNDDEMIPSSPEEKKKKSSGLSVGHGFLKREKMSLTHARSSTKEKLSSTSPDVVEITEDLMAKDFKKKNSESGEGGKRRIDFDAVECRDLESQETLYTESEDRSGPGVTSKEVSPKTTEKSESLKVSESFGECEKQLDDDFDTEPVTAVERFPFGDDESQESCKDSQENLTGDFSDNGRSKCGLKRKLKDLKIIKAKDLILGKRSSSDDEEVEVLEVKKARKSVEVVYSKPTTKPSQIYLSPSMKSSLSSQSSSASSSPSIMSPNSKQSLLSRKLSLKSNVTGVKIVKLTIDSEEFVEEEFTLHMSPSEGSQAENNSTPVKLTKSSEIDPKASNNCGTMSTIMEVDEGCPSLDESSIVSGKDHMKNVPEEEKNKPAENEEVAMECEEVGERSSHKVVRPSSPEYLSEDDVGEKSWIGLSQGDLNEKANEGDKEEPQDKKQKMKNSAESYSNGHISEHPKVHNSEEDITLKGSSEGVPEDSRIETEPMEKLTGELEKNGASADPSHATTELHRWFLIHVVQDFVIETGQISRTKVLEIQHYSGENGKNTPKEKVYGRVSDVSKTSSVDSKSSPCLGDISSPPNPISPQSLSGDAKLFPLPPPRTSILSTFSHSSSSTSGSDLAVSNLRGKAIFTKPHQPLAAVKDKGFIPDDITLDVKAIQKTKSDASTEIPKQFLNIPEPSLSKIEQAIHEYCLNFSDSKNLLAKVTLEETSKKVLPERRYLSRRSKGKRLPLRLKKKALSSSKTSTAPTSSQNNSKNTEDQDTLPIEESLCDTISPKTPKPVNILPSTPLSARTKEARGRARHSAKKNISETSSENTNGVNPLKHDKEGSPKNAGIEQELPCTPKSSTISNAGISCGMLSAGTLVFARFSDKWYYPGKVRQQQKDDRWVIDFDDGDSKWVIEDYIVAVDVLEQGQSVYAAVGEKDAEYEPGIVTKVEIKKQAYYTVELDIGITKVFPRSKLCLTEDQVNIIKELKKEPVPSTPKRKADVSLDNVLEGKRTRGKKTAESMAPSTPGTSKSHTDGRPVPPSWETSSSVSTVSEMSEPGTGFENIPGLEPAASPEPLITSGKKGKGPGRRKGRGKQSNNNEQRDSSSGVAELSKTLASNVTIIDLGPIPQKDSLLFKGKYFILNYSANKEIQKKKPRTRKTRSDTSSGDGTESCEEMNFSITPFVRNHLKKQLEAGGGIVFDRYEDDCRGKTCYLISNKCNLTNDYVLSLSSDIQSISHDWVINCCIKGEPLPWMENLLPVGWSLEEERYIEWHERSSQALKNVDIVLASDSGKQFLEFWRRVLATAGAHVRKVCTKTMSSQEDISYARVVVTDHTCPAGILDRANETGIPMVSTVWVHQSLIHGKMRPFVGHPSYKYDYRHID